MYSCYELKHINKCYLFITFFPYTSFIILGVPNDFLDYFFFSMSTIGILLFVLLDMPFLTPNFIWKMVLTNRWLVAGIKFIGYWDIFTVGIFICYIKIDPAFYVTRSIIFGYKFIILRKDPNIFTLFFLHYLGTYVKKSKIRR